MPASGPDRSTVRRPGRAKVMKAARETVAAVGPDRVTVKLIADRAGMSTGHVMYYFGRRERILVDVLLASEAELCQELEGRLARAAGPVEAAERFVRLYLPTGPDDVRWKLWAQLIASPPTDPPTRRVLADVLAGWSAALEQVVARGVGAGAFVCDDPAELGYRFCRTMDGLALEILMGTPGRTRAWAVRFALTALTRELAV